MAFSSITFGGVARAAVVLAVLLLGAAWQLRNAPTLDVINPDGIEYVGAAYNLVERGVYSVAPPGQPPTPDNFREPGLSAVIAVLMTAAPDWVNIPPACIFENAKGCAAAFQPLLTINIVANALAAGLLAVCAYLMTGSWLSALTVAVLMSWNPTLMRAAREIVSDYVALALLSAAILCALLAVKRRQAAWALPSGLAFAGLTLNKAVFLYFIGPLTLGMLIAAALAVNARRTVLAALALFLLGFVPPVGGWMARNAVQMGAPSITEGRGSLVLAHRLLMNEMTAAEYAVAFLWWTRGVGDDIARAYLPESVHARFNVGLDGGWQKGGDALWRSTIAQISAEQGIAPAEAERAARRLFLGEIVAQWPKHLAVTVPVFYRGIWVDTFVWLTFPAFLVCLWRLLRNWDPMMMVALAPGLYTLGVHALLTPNVPRFQIPTVTAFFLAAAVLTPELHRRWRDRPRKSVGA